MTMRTEATEASYQLAKTSKNLKQLSEEPAINEWDYWRLIDNRFPHDRHHERHHLLVAKSWGTREAPKQFWDLTPAALHQLQTILQNLNGQYDVVKYNFPAIQSVPTVCHLHLLNLKPEYK